MPSSGESRASRPSSRRRRSTCSIRGYVCAATDSSVFRIQRPWLNEGVTIVTSGRSLPGLPNTVGDDRPRRPWHGPSAGREDTSRKARGPGPQNSRKSRIVSSPPSRASREDKLCRRRSHLVTLSRRRSCRNRNPVRCSISRRSSSRFVRSFRRTRFAACSTGDLQDAIRCTPASRRELRSTKPAVEEEVGVKIVEFVSDGVPVEGVRGDQGLPGSLVAKSNSPGNFSGVNASP